MQPELTSVKQGFEQDPIKRTIMARLFDEYVESLTIQLLSKSLPPLIETLKVVSPCIATKYFLPASNRIGSGNSKHRKLLKLPVVKSEELMVRLRETAPVTGVVLTSSVMVS